MLAFSAHWIGTWLKHSSHHSKLRQRVPYYIGVLAALAIVGPLFLLLALVREKFIQFLERTSVSFGEMLQTEGFAETASNLIGTEMTSAGWTLVLINLAIIGLGIGASLLRHDAHPDYEALKRRADKTKRKYDKIRAQYEAKIDELTNERDKRLFHLQSHHERIENDLAELEKARELVQQRDKAAIERLALDFKQRLQVYELANRRAVQMG